jgi:hypothetical protein
LCSIPLRIPDPISWPIVAGEGRLRPAAGVYRADDDRLRNKRDAGERGDLELPEYARLDGVQVRLLLDVAGLAGDEGEVERPVVDLDQAVPGKGLLGESALVLQQRPLPLGVEHVDDADVEPHQFEGLLKRLLQEPGKRK